MSKLLDVNKIAYYIDMIEEFLLDHNWHCLKEYDSFSVWNLKNNPTFKTDIRLPINSNNEYADDIDLIEEAINKLAILFNSNFEFVLQSIINKKPITSFSKISFRVISNDVKKGNIPLDEGINLISSVKKFIENIAKATETRKTSFSSYKSKNIMDFMGSIQLGQTEIGSYVVNLHYPIQTIRSFDSVNNIQQSFSECVENDIELGLKTLTEIVMKNKYINDIATLVQKGISANLCDSLINLTGLSQNRNVEIILHNKEKKVSSFYFDKTRISLIKNISQKLHKDEFILDNFTVIGFVVDRHSLSGNLLEGGKISIKMFIVGKMRNIDIELDTKQYLIANDAVKLASQVSITGRLSIKKTNGILVNVSNIKIVEQKKLDFNK